MYQPTAAAGEFPVTVRPSEIAIVAIVLCVWATAVYVFINQWGKSSAKIHIPQCLKTIQSSIRHLFLLIFKHCDDTCTSLANACLLVT